jgi:hypothetical protein
MGIASSPRNRQMIRCLRQMDCIRLPYQIARYDASRFAAQIGCRFGAQTIENKSHFSHRNVTCGDMDFRASRLREAQKFIGDSWFRLYHKPAKPRRRLGERRSSYRQEDSEKTPAAGGSNRCERRHGPRKVHRALPRGRRSKSEGHSIPEPIACTFMNYRKWRRLFMSPDLR